MATKLFETKDRNESHKKLEKLLESYPSAECREEIQNGNGPTLYQVWDGSDEVKVVSSRPPPDQAAALAATKAQFQLSDADVSRIADAILAKTKAK